MISGVLNKNAFGACLLALSSVVAQVVHAETLLPQFDADAFSGPAPKSNPFFPLISGTTQTLVSQNGEFERSELTVFSHGPTILGIETTIILDRDFEDDRLTEEAREFFAQDRHGNVWFFGEDVTSYIYDRSGKLVATNNDEGWLAGVDGALPGHIMPANPQVGVAYLQEYSVNQQALDEGKIYAVGASLVINGTSFENIVIVLETSSIEPDERELKFYAPGIGLIRIEEGLDQSLKNPEIIFNLSP